MKKKVLIGIIIVLLLLLLIPIPMRLKDGGSIEYKAILYTITKYHQLVPISETQEIQYIDGIGIKILGMEIYNNTKDNIKPPQLEVYTSSTNKAKCITGSYSWQETSENGKITSVQADALHPIDFEYTENNILNIQEDVIIYLENKDINIKNVKIQSVKEKSELLSEIEIDKLKKKINLIDIPVGEYILEINVSYSQGDVCYGVRVNIVDMLPGQESVVYEKISDSNLIAEGTSTDILVKYNGILYGKSFAMIDFAGNLDNYIGIIDKLIDKEHVPVLNGETNIKEILNAKVLSVGDRTMVLEYNNEAVLFEKIKSADNFEILFYEKQPIDSYKTYTILGKSETKKYDYTVYGHNGSVNIRIDGKDYSLKEALVENKITMDEIIAKANIDLKNGKITGETYKDGGSIVYKYDTYTIIKCHTLDGNRDVYIGVPSMTINDVL